MDIRNLIKKIIKEDFSGWLNVKADMEIHERVKRLTLGMGITRGGVEGLREKVEYLSNPKEMLSGMENLPFDERFTKVVSTIVILEYLKELKHENLFDPSMSGFLFEPFISGLVNGEPVRDSSKRDVVDDVGNFYQIKLFDKKTPFKLGEAFVSPSGENIYKEYPSQTIIGFKLDSDRVELIRINKTKLYKQFAIKGQQSVSYGILKDIGKSLGTMDTANVDSHINLLSENLNVEINNIWETMSKMHYAIEGMMTGINEGNNSISVQLSGQRSIELVKQLKENINSFLTVFNEHQ